MFTQDVSQKVSMCCRSQCAEIPLKISHNFQGEQKVNELEDLTCSQRPCSVNGGMLNMIYGPVDR